jgi:predicted DNA-binding transcriptional regulator YafY
MRRLQRLYKLLTLIRTRDMKADGLAAALEVSKSQVEKDIRYLREEMGIHIEYCSIDSAYYSKNKPNDLIEKIAEKVAVF